MPPVSEILFLHLARKWSDTRRIAAAYFNLVNGVALPDSFPDELVMNASGDTVEPDLVALPASVPVPPGPVPSGVAK